MKKRIAIWAGVGFLGAGLWAVVIYSSTLEQFLLLMSLPVVRAVLYVSCPVAYFGYHYPIKLWSVLLINALTFALFGLIVEMLRARWNRRAAAH